LEHGKGKQQSMHLWSCKVDRILRILLAMDRIRRIRHGKEGTAHPSSGRCSTDVLPLSSHYQTWTHILNYN